MPYQLKIYPIIICFLFLKIDLISAQDFDARSALLINTLAENYKGACGNVDPGNILPKINDGSCPSDMGKYAYPRVIARLDAIGEDDAYANDIVTHFSGMKTFHFNLVGVPRIIYGYSGMNALTDSVKKEYLDRVWERTDSYNAWTGEGTENHLSMSRTSAYLYAQLAQNEFPADYPDAADRLSDAKEWIEYFSKRIYTTGTGEWNSSIYGVYNVIGWLNLYDFAEDEAVKKMARAVLDYYAGEIALHYVQGTIGGADFRGNRKTTSFDGGTTFLGWLWFGDGPIANDAIDFVNTDAAQVVHAATSSYRPPQAAIKLATKAFTYPEMYFNSKPGYLLEDPALIKQSFYIDNGYTIGAAYLPYGGWTSGNYQTVSWKLTAGVDPGDGKSTQHISGIGMQSPDNGYYKYGNQRSPFDQLVHHDNVLVQMTKVPENASSIKNEVFGIINQWKQNWAADFDSRFPGDKDKSNPIKEQNLDVSDNRSYMMIKDEGQVSVIMPDSIVFGSLDKVYFAIQALQSAVPATPFTSGSNDDAFHITYDEADKGKLCGMILEVSTKTDFNSFEHFQDSIRQSTSINKKMLDADSLHYVNLAGDTIKIKYNESGSYTEPIYDWGYGPESPLVVHQSPPFLQPDWPSGPGYGKTATWSVNGKAIDLEETWSVYDGPKFMVKEGVLQLIDTDIDEIYQVDYTNDVPVFSEESIGKVEAPVITPASDELDGTEQSIEVNINTSTSDADIYYTLNGKTPTVFDNKYSGSITLDESAVVKARAFQEGLIPSDVAQHKYELQHVVTGIKNENFGINVYPSPSDGNFILYLKGAYRGEVEIRLLDLQGKVRYNSDFTKNTSVIDQLIILPELNDGIYVLQVFQGEHTSSTKLMIK